MAIAERWSKLCRYGEKKYSEKDMLDAIQVDQGGQCDRNRETMSYRRTGKRGKWKLLSPVQLFVTPWTVAHQAPQHMEFSRKEYWSGLPCPPPGDLPDPGIKPRTPALQADSLPFKSRKPSVKEERDAYYVWPYRWWKGLWVLFWDIRETVEGFWAKLHDLT